MSSARIASSGKSERSRISDVPTVRDPRPPRTPAGPLVAQLRDFPLSEQALGCSGPLCKYLHSDLKRKYGSTESGLPYILKRTSKAAAPLLMHLLEVARLPTLITDVGQTLGFPEHVERPWRPRPRRRSAAPRAARADASQPARSRPIRRVKKPDRVHLLQRRSPRPDRTGAGSQARISPLHSKRNGGILAARLSCTYCRAHYASDPATEVIPHARAARGGP